MFGVSKSDRQHISMQGLASFIRRPFRFLNYTIICTNSETTAIKQITRFLLLNNRQFNYNIHLPPQTEIYIKLLYRLRIIRWSELICDLSRFSAFTPGSLPVRIILIYSTACRSYSKINFKI